MVTGRCRVPWNKGKKGYKMKHSKQFKKGMIPWNKGKKASEETRLKFSSIRKGKNLGEKHHLFGKKLPQKKFLVC